MYINLSTICLIPLNPCSFQIAFIFNFHIAVLLNLNILLIFCNAFAQVLVLVCSDRANLVAAQEYRNRTNKKCLNELQITKLFIQTVKRYCIETFFFAKVAKPFESNMQSPYSYCEEMELETRMTKSMRRSTVSKSKNCKNNFGIVARLFA